MINFEIESKEEKPQRKFFGDLPVGETFVLTSVYEAFGLDASKAAIFIKVDFKKAIFLGRNAHNAVIPVENSMPVTSVELIVSDIKLV